MPVSPLPLVEVVVFNFEAPENPTRGLRVHQFLSVSPYEQVLEDITYPYSKCPLTLCQKFIGLNDT
jgi:hypothetical protein